MTAADDVRRLLEDGDLDLAPIGRGQTRQRWLRLAAIACSDVSTARLAEAHVDGIQILHESGRSHPSARLLGVWASESPHQMLQAELTGATVTFRGSKAFCTGAGIVDDVLVTAVRDSGPALFLVPCEAITAERIDRSSWQAFAMRETDTASVDFDGVTISADSQIGEPGWYLERPGFWHGAIGPAACWAGAAQGLVDYARAAMLTDAHARAHLGAMTAIRWALSITLDAAGDAADREPHDGARAYERALGVRYLVDDACREIQDRFGRALGPRPLVHDPQIAERFDALTIYRRQCHAERDLAALGAINIRAIAPG